MRNFSDKVAGKIMTHILCKVTFSFENRAICEIMWKNIVEPGWPQILSRPEIILRSLQNSVNCVSFVQSM